MVRRLIALLAMGLLPLGCLIDIGKSLPEPRVVSIFKAGVVSNANRKVEFSITCTVPEPCWGFVRSEQAVIGTDVYIKAFARRLTNDPCPQVLSSIDVNIIVPVSSAGNYQFHFWRSDTSSVDIMVSAQ